MPNDIDGGFDMSRLLCILLLGTGLLAGCAAKDQPTSKRASHLAQRPPIRIAAPTLLSIEKLPTEQIRRKVIAEPKLLEAKDAHGNTLLHRAVSLGRVDVVRMLLSLGCKPDLSNSYGQTPLQLVAEESRTGIARLLISKGSDVNKANDKGDTALHAAVRSCYIAHISCEPQRSKRRGDPAIITLLLTHGAKINARNRDKETSLYEAISGMDCRVVSMLVRAGADIEAKDTSGRTPLYTAVDSATPGSCCGFHTKLYVPIIRALLDAGANVNVADNRGESVLHAAVELTDTEAECIFTAILARRDLNVNTKNDRGETPLYRAADFGKTSAVRALLKRGADRTIRDNKNDPPFNAALLNNHTEAASLLEF